MILPIEAQRLLDVARAVRESSNPGSFYMGSFGNAGNQYCPEKIPECALGHYAVRKDLQKVFGLYFSSYDEETYLVELAPKILGLSIFRLTRGKTIAYDAPLVLTHFGITTDEAKQLFSAKGCENTTYIDEAATYIERFVAKKWCLDPAFVKFKTDLLATKPLVDFT